MAEDIRDSVLFRSLAPHIKSISTNRLIYELMLVQEDAENNGKYFNSEHELSNSFMWDGSPQGYKFWSAFNRELRENERA